MKKLLVVVAVVVVLLLSACDSVDEEDLDTIKAELQEVQEFSQEALEWAIRDVSTIIDLDMVGIESFGDGMLISSAVERTVERAGK